MLAVLAAVASHSLMLAGMLVESPLARVLAAVAVLTLAMVEAAGHRLVLQRRGGGGQFPPRLLHRLAGSCLVAFALVAGHGAGAARSVAPGGHPHGSDMLPPGVLLGVVVLGYLLWTAMLAREVPRRVLFSVEAALLVGMIAWMLLAGGHGAEAA